MKRPIVVYLALLACGARSALEVPSPQTSPPHSLPTLVAGQSHTCWQSTGILWCWGSNANGEIGDGTTTNRLVPTRIESDVVGVAAADGFTADLHADGDVRWWGSIRQIDSSVTTRLTPATIANSQARIFARGLGYDMFLTDASGATLCWGMNNYTFGLDNPLSFPDVTLTPIACPNFDGAIDVATSQTFTCALWANGEVRCAGDDSHGQFADGGAAIPATLPRLVPNISATQVAVGGAYTCAILQDTTVACWGVNGSGQLGDGTTTEQHVPTPVLGLIGAKRIVASVFHTCAVLEQGGLVCWGRNSEGEIGDGNLAATALPTVVTGIGAVSEVALGAFFTCALTADGAIWCWGANDDGELGDGTTNAHASPAPVVMPK